MTQERKPRGWEGGLAPADLKSLSTKSGGKPSSQPVSRFQFSRLSGRAWSWVVHKHIAMCALFLIVFFAGSKQTLRAQTRVTTPNRLPSAEKIVDSYLKTIGGRKRIANIRDATYEWEIQLKERSMGIAKTQIKFPASVRAQLTFGNGEIVSAANPRSAWIYGLDGRVHTLTDAEAAAARLQAGLDASHLVDIKKHNILARIVSLKAGAAESAYVVEFSLRSGARLRYLFSPTTKLLIGIEDDARKITTRFGDYRSEGRILEAHRMNLDIRGSGELTFLLKRVTYNGGIADAVFDPPQPAEALDVPALLREVSRNQDQLKQRFTEYSFIQKETAREVSAVNENCSVLDRSKAGGKAKCAAGSGAAISKMPRGGPFLVQTSVGLTGQFLSHA